MAAHTIVAQISPIPVPIVLAKKKNLIASPISLW
jgi:hypothetical protein